VDPGRIVVRPADSTVGVPVASSEGMGRGLLVGYAPIRPRGRHLLGLVLPGLAAFVAVGSLGLYRYLDNYWVYRGFPPPRDPGFVTARGTAERFYVASPALGGRSQPVDVYLPPGYADDPQQRYPVLYLLHGFPGKPGAFLLTVKAGVDEDELVAQNRMQPLIFVMPFGSTGQFTDKEWVNGVQAHEGWATFVARDVVRAVDARYRTIATGAGRAIGGLSEGGYGAINIALHHPGEFHVIESWSGYQLADPIDSIFGGSQRLLADNSPLLRLPLVAPALRRDRTYVWFYVGSSDGKHLLQQNAAFAAALARQHIPHRFVSVSGGHNWRVWRDRAPLALLAASSHLAHG
jgi:enterochelin esterase-like enzyme